MREARPARPQPGGPGDEVVAEADAVVRRRPREHEAALAASEDARRAAECQLSYRRSQLQVLRSRRMEAGQVPGGEPDERAGASAACKGDAGLSRRLMRVLGRGASFDPVESWMDMKLPEIFLNPVWVTLTDEMIEVLPEPKG
ncbi:hypothetical protein [Streptomyces sp. NPDC056468]|uniref:hypothetical protein n=1 Tax=Streptomyces sp. NPDC056468 TaxID=3345830 RepID=UPI0036A6AF17